MRQAKGTVWKYRHPGNGWVWAAQLEAVGFNVCVSDRVTMNEAVNICNRVVLAVGFNVVDWKVIK